MLGENSITIAFLPDIFRRIAKRQLVAGRMAVLKRFALRLQAPLNLLCFLLLIPVEEMTVEANYGESYYCQLSRAAESNEVAGYKFRPRDSCAHGSIYIVVSVLLAQ